jgi:hypothetical protein
MRIRLLWCVAVVSLAVAAPTAARAAGALPAAATPLQREQAQTRFLRGKDLLARKQYDQALEEFTASHEIVASPNARLEIARCLRALGKIVAAYAELGRTAIEAKELVAQDPRYLRASEAAIAEREEMERQLGVVSLTIQNPTDATTVVIGGEEIRRAAWSEPAPVVTGPTDIVVQTPGHAPVKRTVSLSAGQKTTIVIDAQSGDPLTGTVAPPPDQPAPPPGPNSGPSPLRLGAYVAGGVGVAGLLVFTIGGVMAKSTYDDLDNSCHGGPCPPSKNGEISSGKTQQTLANVGLVVGIAGVAAGTTLFVLSMNKSAPSASTGLLVAPGWVGVRGGW